MQIDTPLRHAKTKNKENKGAENIFYQMIGGWFCFFYLLNIKVYVMYKHKNIKLYFFYTPFGPFN